MIKKHLILNLTYALSFIVVLISAYAEIPLLGYILKPFIHLILLAFLFISTRLRGRFHQRLFTGTVFALTGQTLFMLHSYNPSYFLFGLVCFLISHLFYISAFYLDFLSAKELDKKGARIAIFISAILFSAFYFYLRSHLGTYKLPVLAYIFIAALLLMMAAFRNQRVNAASFNLVLAGVILMIGADAVLASAHFVAPFHLSEVIVSAGYMAGQYLIILGGAERKLVHTQTPL